MEAVKLNPYTQAMKNCLEQYPDSDEVPELDETNSQFLANMVQGRFLQYLVMRICIHHGIQNKELEKQLSMAMMNLMSDKLFAVFREKVRRNPNIVYEVARNITKFELIHGDRQISINTLFRDISRDYFEYHDLRTIMRWIFSNPEIEKIVFLSRIQNQITDPILIRTLTYIIQNDKDGIAPTIFNRYLNKDKIERLANIVKSGDWKIEASFVQAQSAKLINWREYMTN